MSTRDRIVDGRRIPAREWEAAKARALPGLPVADWATEAAS